MKISLAVRYAMVLSGAILAVVAVFATLYLTQYRSTSESLRTRSSESLHADLMEQIRQRGETLNSVLVERLVNPVYRLDMLAIYELIRETSDLPDVEYVFLVDEDQRIFHDGTRNLLAYGQRWYPPGDSANEKAVGGIRRDPQRVLELSAEVELAGDQLGTVYLGMSLAPVIAQTAAIDASLGQMLQAHQRTALRTLAFYSAMLLLAGVVLALAIARGMVQPIRQLAGFAVGVGKGEYGRPPHIDRRDEIGLLASSLHEMSANLKKTTSEAEFLAYHDSLTLLPNRAQLKRYLSSAIQIALEANTSLAVLFIDLDDFKKVNDTLGHEAGDEFLKAFAQRLTDSLTDTNTDTAVVSPLQNGILSRLGGDEFTIILESIADPQAAERAAQFVLKQLEEPFVVKGHSIVVGASIGITLCPQHSCDMGMLLHNADIAMYQAKCRGRNNYCVYDATMDIAT